MHVLVCACSGLLRRPATAGRTPPDEMEVFAEDGRLLDGAHAPKRAFRRREAEDDADLAYREARALLQSYAGLAGI